MREGFILEKTWGLIFFEEKNDFYSQGLMRLKLNNSLSFFFVFFSNMNLDVSKLGH